eukprot:TRINITY_DN983_c0_g1_i15.p1 TRINITY_DN983_c0_g1~~TRINITY_DN983_c0_g1_i15.p1  ORF type:complete len:210 (-),score=47.11 TRINITY_DN983_c0_g1_i15:697-1326(-)
MSCLIVMNFIQNKLFFFFFFQAEDGIRDVERSRGLGDVYKRQVSTQSTWEDTRMEAVGVPIILDCGSGMTKVGLGGETNPRAVFPTLVGKPRTTSGMPMMAGKVEYIGDEAMAKKGVLKLDFPIENGIIRNWDAMSSIWMHALMNEVRMSPNEHPVLLTDSDRDPTVNKEKNGTDFLRKIQGALPVPRESWNPFALRECGDYWNCSRLW